VLQYFSCYLLVSSIIILVCLWLARSLCAKSLPLGAASLRGKHARPSGQLKIQYPASEEQAFQRVGALLAVGPTQRQGECGENERD